MIERLSARINDAEIFFHGRHYPVRGDDGTINGITGIYMPLSLRTSARQGTLRRYFAPVLGYDLGNGT